MTAWAVTPVISEGVHRVDVELPAWVASRLGVVLREVGDLLAAHGAEDEWDDLATALQAAGEETDCQRCGAPTLPREAFCEPCGARLLRSAS